MLILLMSLTLAGGDPDGVIATAPPSRAPLEATAQPESTTPEAGGQAQAHGLDTDAQIARWLADRGPVERSADALTWRDASEGAEPRRVHGQVTAAVGTNDYSAYGVDLSVPLGERAQLDLHYSRSKNDPYAWGRGYGSGYGYAHDPRWEPGSAPFGAERRERATERW